MSCSIRCRSRSPTSRCCRAHRRRRSSGGAPPRRRAFSRRVQRRCRFDGAAAALARLALRAPLRAAHVDHGLGSVSRPLERRTARPRLGRSASSSPTVRVAVERSARWARAAARKARYAALADLLSPGDVLLTAHHGDDQLETVLLRLLRGSGVRGLRAIREPDVVSGSGIGSHAHCSAAPARDRRAGGRLGIFVRLDDTANPQPQHDRNSCAPPLCRRLMERCARGGAQCAASHRANGRTRKRFSSRSRCAMRLRRGQLRQGAARGARAARSRAPAQSAAPLGAAAPASSRRAQQKIEELRAALLDGRPDAQPRIRWAGVDARGFRGHLYLMPALPAAWRAVSRRGSTKPRLDRPRGGA